MSGYGLFEHGYSYGLHFLCILFGWDDMIVFEHECGLHFCVYKLDEWIRFVLNMGMDCIFCIIL